MQQSMHQITVGTPGRGLIDVTSEIEDWVAGQRVRDGLLTLFLRHTSASLLIQENADPDVLRDLDDFFARLVADDMSLYRHTAEGPDDMPAHIRAALTQTHLAVPVQAGRMSLGAWQGVYLFEHRTSPHRRNILLHLQGVG